MPHTYDLLSLGPSSFLTLRSQALSRCILRRQRVLNRAAERRILILRNFAFPREIDDTRGLGVSSRRREAK